ncbi:N-methyl-D-aspartate receptor NMDAR2C subunit [Chitinimonas arctica]|uniref:N-methyl-D-aspartate receptor NMDAR2C subunit n=1 Tax=Chitinimonas arctica TaxID=2594795 RepID=A0A516SID2_9NEIS|nr:N-methyl-D-aspartate receptor NMDAR2C subunit [Chitinimonas arctica]QDQ27911.1 N-methyl-D-aspartate receptor NMDAR2C subunit [Chitinimonas arctica]
MMDFRTAWTKMWPRLGLIESPACLDTLLARYSEPHRHYHTLQHLEECLVLFWEVEALAEHAAEVEIALWFHDAIYEPLRQDNEQRSADWARETLLAAGAERQVAERVYGLIMATRHTAEPRGQDAQLLIDIDLAILAAKPARFDEYEEQIRAEYRHVPELLFRSKRRSVLEKFLERPHIYSTQPLRERFEAVARDNLAKAIDCGRQYLY